MSLFFISFQDIRQHDQNLEFVKPLFTMGQAAGSTSSLRESQILNMNQKDIMRDFRSGKCNLLVATSVLEEGVDIPECNLIVRFDKIRTYCDYVQTKGNRLFRSYIEKRNFTGNFHFKITVRSGKVQESLFLYAGE